MKKKFLLLMFSLFLLSACADLTQVLTHMLESSISDENSLLSQTEIVAGLKEALSLGVGNSIETLSAKGGYFNSEDLKIQLPPEADIITENLAKIPGGQYLIDKVISGINDAASDAAAEASPILIESVENMSFVDAVGVLAGGENAATNYLKESNFDELLQLYQPRIQSSLDKVYVDDVSPQSTWDELTGKWNEIANSIVGLIAGLKPVETDLSRFLTESALDGMFLKIADSEATIRSETSARVTPLLERVFSQENIAALLKK